MATVAELCQYLNMGKYVIHYIFHMSYEVTTTQMVIFNNCKDANEIIYFLFYQEDVCIL